MALCPTVANPIAPAEDELNLYDTVVIDGDYTVAGCGTRNSGSGTIVVKGIPPNTTVDTAYFIYNTYVSNNIANPTVLLNGSDASSSLYGICGSTCWVNPGPELTTYLRNKVYITDVTTGFGINGNGKYTVSGLPTDPSMRIGTDGDRVPGCQCSQGAILVIIWKWNDGAGPTGVKRERQIQLHVGAKLIATPTGIWGGSTSYAYNFDPGLYKGNSNIVLAAGDTQTSITGESININGVQFVPPNNAFVKIGRSISIRKFSVANLYEGMDNNLAYVKTTNDCVCWFFFGVSGDKTDPPAKFQSVSCAANQLLTTINSSVTEMDIFSNINADPPTVGCYAVPTGGFGRPPFYAVIDKEIIKVTGKSGADPQDQTTWTIVRGQGGTTATSHTQGACVRLAMPVESKQAMQAALNQKGQAAQRAKAGMNAGNDEEE